MSSGPLKLLAGAGGIAEPVYVDDVFSTYLYEGNNTSRSIVNGIDLSDKGGLVWTKNRDDAFDHNFVDSERGLTNSPYIRSNQTGGGTDAQGITVFNSNGYTVGTSYSWNASNQSHVSWTFAKQEKFFDIVTYTGDGTTGRSVAHNLGSVPGMILIKNLTAENWIVYHRGIGNTKALVLNSDAAVDTSSGYWNNTDPTSTHFTLGNASGPRNENGVSYVAYLFAHHNNDGEFGEDSDEDIIKCGSFNAGSTGFVENLGFEPQWLLVKKTSGTGSWQVIDNMRGSAINKNGDHNSRSLIADNSGTENSAGFSFGVANTGIGVEIADGATYAYVAIRRPHKPASEFSNTDAFKVQYLSAGEGSDTFISTGFPVDSVWYRKGTDSSPIVFGDRLRGGNKSGGDLKTSDSDAEATNSGAFFLDHNDGATVDHSGGHFNASPSATDEQYARYFFRRMKGFFDFVIYLGDGTTSHAVNHNLGVPPEMIIVKDRNRSANWSFYHQNSPVNASGKRYNLLLNAANAAGDSDFWPSTPTATQFVLGDSDQGVNRSNDSYVAYLFATADGISKVGGYTGTGSALNVDCGFSAGAKLVIIKRTDSGGNWYLWDSGRGINSGNEPYFLMNNQAAGQEGGYDSIDPLSAGFTVAPATGTDININGATYIFLAIA